MKRIILLNNAAYCLVTFSDHQWELVKRRDKLLNRIVAVVEMPHLGGSKLPFVSVNTPSAVRKLNHKEMYDTFTDYFRRPSLRNKSDSNQHAQ
jgi:hypothetical protein